MLWILAVLALGCSEKTTEPVEPTFSEQLVGDWKLVDSQGEGVFYFLYTFGPEEYTYELWKMTPAQLLWEEKGIWQADSTTVIFSITEGRLRGYTYRQSVTISEPFIWIGRIGGRRNETDNSVRSVSSGLEPKSG